MLEFDWRDLARGVKWELAPVEPIRLGWFPGTGRVGAQPVAVRLKPTLLSSGQSVPFTVEGKVLHVAPEYAFMAGLRAIGFGGSTADLNMSLSVKGSWASEEQRAELADDVLVTGVGASKVVRETCGVVQSWDDTRRKALGVDPNFGADVAVAMLGGCPSTPLFQIACETIPAAQVLHDSDGDAWTERLQLCGTAPEAWGDIVVRAIATAQTFGDGVAYARLEALHAHLLELGENKAAGVLRAALAAPWLETAGPKLTLASAALLDPSDPLLVVAVRVAKRDPAFSQRLEAAWLKRQSDWWSVRCTSAAAFTDDVAYMNRVDGDLPSNFGASARERLAGFQAQAWTRCAQMGARMVVGRPTNEEFWAVVPNDVLSALRTLQAQGGDDFGKQFQAALGATTVTEKSAFDRVVGLAFEPSIGNEPFVSFVARVITMRLGIVRARGLEALANELVRLDGRLPGSLADLPVVEQAKADVQRWRDERAAAERAAAEARAAVEAREAAARAAFKARAGVAQRAALVTQYQKCVDQSVRQYLKAPEQGIIANIQPLLDSDEIGFMGYVSSPNGFGVRIAQGFGVVFPDADVRKGDCPQAKDVWFCENRTGCGWLERAMRNIDWINARSPL